MAETPISSDPRYRARPTVRIDDQQNELVTHRVNTFKVTENVGGLSSLEMRLANEPGAEPDTEAHDFEDEQDIALGSAIAIYSGDEYQPREIFRGIVTALDVDFSEDGPAEIVVLAEDQLQSGRLARRSKVYDNLQISQLANDIASALSLTPVVTGFTEGLGTHTQLNESDLAFLRRIIRRYDGDVQVVGRELHVSARKDVSRGTVEVRRPDGQLRKARFLADLAHQTTEVTTAGYDADSGQPINGSASGANLGPGSGRTGSSILQNKLGSRSEHVGYPPVQTSAMAQSVADTHYDDRARKFVTGVLTTEGNPLIRVGTHLTVTGTSRRFDNTYYVVHVCHRFDLDRGYETDCEVECAYLGNP